ncbi:SCO2522 family protein [Actinacidiphila alni]|uniref:SCO2522 family protein n=1 Tax=Actinacidiphila alni TaxID=380248 RepID=UPI0033DC4A0D
MRVTDAPGVSGVSLELGHLYMEDFEEGPGRLREHFARVRPWADAVRARLAADGGAARISTCFLVDDYFTRFSSPAEIVPLLVAQAASAGLTIDYLARESGCAVAEGAPLAETVRARLTEPPAPRGGGRRPPAAACGWLPSGPEPGPGPAAPAAMADAHQGRGSGAGPGGGTATLTAVPAPVPDDVFLDVEMWNGPDDDRLWSCPFLAAVWQLARLGLLPGDGHDLPVPRDLAAVTGAGGGLPTAWDDLPPLVRLVPDAAPFTARRTVSVLPARFLSVEHAVRVILGRVDGGRPAPAAGPNGEPPTADRVSYVFYGP